jgi:uncharacterized protein YfaS (alpha-2-macroglobulin family)
MLRLLLFLLPFALIAESADRTDAINKMNRGHFKDALPIFETLLASEDAQAVDLHSAVQCAASLGLHAERDALCEQAVDNKPNDWRMLAAAAQIYMAEPHQGRLIDGRFERGYNYQNQAELRYSYARDRVRALQLYQQAMQDKELPMHVFAQIAGLFHYGSVPLHQLTDLTRLPDYGTQYDYYYPAQRRAPVGADGKPIFFRIPASFAESANDGERWMWLRQQAGQTLVDHQYPQWLHGLYGVQTMQSWAWRPQEDEDRQRQTGIMAVHTLTDDETIAHTTGGVQRFKLPPEHNFIRIYQQLAAGGDLAAKQQLAQIYLNRRQYPRAAKQIQNILRKQKRNVKQHEYNLRQIFHKWGRFEPAKPFPAGTPPTLGFRYRNATEVSFTARRIDMEGLISRLQRNITNARDYPDANLEALGQRLVTQGDDESVGGTVARWQARLDPDPEHFDRSQAITTPKALAEPGVYLIEAKVFRGNTTRIVIRVDDTAIVRKPVDSKIWYFVVDAATGKPVPHAKLDFFGYRTEWVNSKLPFGRKVRTHITRFSESADANGQLSLDNKTFRDKHSYHWMCTAQAGNRLAHSGFDDFWAQAYRGRKYQEHKTYIVTDRPVYRPGQVVKYKLWAHVAKYDDRELSYAGKRGHIYVTDPKGDNKLNSAIRLDDFGGNSGEWTIPADAVLGQYQIHSEFGGSLMFRVEEYKKPDFEVKVETPDAPIALGDTVQLAISANYYFGAPVTEAEVHLRVLRTPQNSTHYPRGRWDWLYGRGYWWCDYEYPWYTGWETWGCGLHMWWYEPPEPPPETVLELTQPIGKDGRLAFSIDTALAKAMQGDSDHRYSITAEVRDASRRTIVGQGSVVAARQPFRIYAWIDRGYAQAGDSISASFSARTPDDQPVSGAGKLRLLRIRYRDGKPVEEEVESWSVTLNADGEAEQRFVAAQPGQYRLSLTHEGVEGGTIFQVRGPQSSSEDYRFAKLELIPDKREYAPGDTVRLLVNADQPDVTVLLFIRAQDGRYPAPRMLTLDGKSGIAEFALSVDDHPNIFVEGLTVYGAEAHTTIREIVVPPQKQTLDVEILPSAQRYKPGETASIRLRLVDSTGEPYEGSMALTLYDRALEYIAPAAYPNIQSYFWEWRRQHRSQIWHSLDRLESEVLKPRETRMRAIGIFGHHVLQREEMEVDAQMAPGAAQEAKATFSRTVVADSLVIGAGEHSSAAPEVVPVVRRNFADSAYWNGEIVTNANGEAEISLTMPDNLTDWQLRAWGMGKGAKCGEASISVATAKNLLLRMQAPRFFVEKDVVTLSANVHNYLDSAKSVRVVLEHDEHLLLQDTELSQMVEIAAGGEARVDWQMQVAKEGETLIRMKALSKEESDAMELRFPVKVHGAPRTESFSGHMRPDANSASLSFSVPEARRIDSTQLEIRYTPSLAGAMIDALPYLAEFPYGCTEQTLNRFLPTVIVRKMLIDMGIDLEDLQGRKARKVSGGRANPIYDSATVDEMITLGVERLTEMQLRSGGWGWFSGWRERSYPHTTAVVLRGLLIARDSDVRIPSGTIEGGVAWLKSYQKKRLREKHFAAGELDALVLNVLSDAGSYHAKMADALYERRVELSVYSQCLLAMAMHSADDPRVRILQALIEQRLEVDDENQSAWLSLGNSGYWWNWYGSEFEAHAAYLKLLARIDPKGDTAAGIVKYLLNNRRHGTWWNSTRDTAYIVEAFGDFVHASGESKPDMELDILLDGELAKTVRISRDNMLDFDDRLVLNADEITTGDHRLELRRRGTGPIYFNAYLSTFSLQDPIPAAGLEVKAERAYYKVVGDTRIKLADSATVASGDVLEVELSIDSKNDYEYILIEDFKPAGFEGVDLRSGWVERGMHAYLEMRDDRAAFFVKDLPKGRHNLSYRLRAEIPGRFSALPAQVSGMYAPELRGNSVEAKLSVED